MMKRTLCLLLAFVLCLTLLPGGALASAEAEEPMEEPAAEESPAEEQAPEEIPEAAEEETITEETSDTSVPAEEQAPEEPSQDGASDPYALIDSVWADYVRCTDNDLALDTGYYDENDRWVEVGHPWRIDCTPGAVAVNLTDGRKLEGSPYEVWQQVSAIFGEDIPFGWTSDETPENPWGEGTHSAYFVVGNKYYHYWVYVLKNPIASVQAEDVRRKTTDTYSTYWVDEEGNISGPYEFINGWPDRITVTTIQGAVITGTPAEVEEKLNQGNQRFTRGISIFWDSAALDPEHLWGVGEYPAIIDVNGVTADYTVTVIDDPVTSVSVEDITRLASDLSDWTEYYDALELTWAESEEPWRIDCYPYDAGITVTTADGGVYTGDPADVAAQLQEVYGCVFDYGWYNDQANPNDVWGPGTYTAYFWFAGAETEYGVTVAEVPVASVAVADVNRFTSDTVDFLYEYYGAVSTFQRIDCAPRDEEITVTLKDGSVFRGTALEVWDALEEYTGCRVSMTWDSDERPPENWWQAGAHTANLYVCGVGGEYTVNVVENPVRTLYVSGITRRTTDLSDWTEYYDEELGAWVDPGIPWRIDCMPTEITVGLPLGESITGDPYEVLAQIEERFGARPTLSLELEKVFNQKTQRWEEPTPANPWGEGTHTAELCLNGAKCTYLVTVVEDSDAKPIVTLAEDGRTAQVTGDLAGLYARVALILDNGGVSGLYVTQAPVGEDGGIDIPAFHVPGLTVRGVNVALVMSLDEITSPAPSTVSTASLFFAP